MQTIGIKMNSEPTKKPSEPSAKKLDVILYLQGRFPHIIEQILGHLVNDEAILKMEKIPRWSALFLSTSPIWKLRWQRNVEQFPMWGALSSRAKTLKLYDRDAHNYRDLYHSVLDSIRKIENNFKEGHTQKPQQYIIDIPMIGDTPLTVRVNDSNIFVIFEDEIRVFNRWSLTPVTCYKLKDGIKDVQVNNRFVVIGVYSRIAWIVLNAETLTKIQLIDRAPTSEEIDVSPNRYYYLYGDLIYDISIFKARNLAIIKTHQFNKTSRHFETIQERKIECISNKFDQFSTFNMYVDDRYCILDWEYESPWIPIRHIEVRSINTMELIHERDFEAAWLTRREYKDGIIVAETRNDEGVLSMIAWDVHNNRITLIRDFRSWNRPIWISTALFTNYHITFWQDEMCNNIKLLKTIQGTATPTEPSMLDSIPFIINYNSLDCCKFLYCDGIQAFGEKRVEGVLQLVVVDLIGKEVSEF